MLWTAATKVIGVEAFVYICAIEDGFPFAVTGAGSLCILCLANYRRNTVKDTCVWRAEHLQPGFNV